MCTESKLMKFVFVWPVFFYISISISCSVLFLLFFLSICAVTARYFRTVMCGKHTMSRPAVQCYLKHLNYYKWTFKAGFACFHKWKVLLGTVIFFYYCIFWFEWKESLSTQLLLVLLHSRMITFFLFFTWRVSSSKSM